MLSAYPFSTVPLLTALANGGQTSPPPGPPCTACDGTNDGCTDICIGDGDCDSDSQCATGLKCGHDNCVDFREHASWQTESPTGWDTTDDCCYLPGGVGDPHGVQCSYVAGDGIDEWPGVQSGMVRDDGSTWDRRQIHAL